MPEKIAEEDGLSVYGIFICAFKTNGDGMVTPK
jgi:hypothetical protein